MKTYSMIYQGYDELQLFIQKEHMLPNKEYLIRIYTAAHNRTDAVRVAKEVREFFPDGKIIGSSASYLIYNGEICEKECIIAWTEFDHTKVSTKCYSYSDVTPEELSGQVSEDVNKQGARIIFMHFSDNYPRVFEFLADFNRHTQEVRAIGGNVSESMAENAGTPFVFDDKGVYPDCLLTASLVSEELFVYSSAIIGHEPIGEYYQVNQVDGEYWNEIDRKPALEWCREMFGIEQATGMTMAESVTDVLLHFPFILEGHNGASMFVQCEESTGRMKLYHSATPAGQLVRVGYLSPLGSARECRDICKEIEHQPIEEIVCYSCVFRKLHMENCAKWELTPFANTRICGIYCNGEIGWLNGKNEYLNGSLSFLGYAEQENYLPIDQRPFKNLHELEGDNKMDVLNYVLRKQSEHMMQKNRYLMKQVIRQEQEVNRKLFIDPVTGLNNYTKYLYDNKKSVYDKMCMISMENGQILLNHLKTDKFQEAAKYNILAMVDYVRRIGESGNIIFYRIDDFTFAAVAKCDYDSDIFLKVMQEMYVQYGTSNIKIENVVCINQFILVLEQSHLLDKAKLTLVENKRNLQRFLLYKSDYEREVHIGQALDIVVALNDAIKQENVIPYFQPIYDNKEKKLNKFEALMRIPDKNGGILVPYQFMDIAKEYRLYYQISTLMVRKVFELFDDREEMVSINLSAYDINSDEFTSMIFRQLELLKHPEHFIFEILESEEFRNPKILEEFVQLVRMYGVKIAIDDFGSGYSNLVEVAKLQPDLIKIDGQIVRYIQENEISRNLVDIIVFMSERMNIELVAEYVKSEELQKYVMEKGIRYSQGYYLSPPVPYEEIDGLLMKYNRGQS